MNKPVVLSAILSGTVSAAIAAGVTYYVVKKKVEARANADIADVKEHYRLLQEKSNAPGIFGDRTTRTARENYEHAQDIVRNYEMVNDLAYNGTVEELEVAAEQNRTAVVIPPFEEEPEDRDVKFPAGNAFSGIFADYERIEGEPYLISRVEWLNEVPDNYSRDSVTYFEGDEVLYEDLVQDTIDDAEGAVGRRHLHMFGRESDNADVVYVRNDEIETVYEITRHEGYHSILILGLDAEDVGAKEPKVRPGRMRDHDS